MSINNSNRNKKFNTTSTLEIETLILQYLKDYPRSSTREISDGIGYAYIAVWRVMTGRRGTKTSTGLYTDGMIRYIPSYNKKTGRLVWVHELV